mgnify:CR=1 FL=1
MQSDNTVQVPGSLYIVSSVHGDNIGDALSKIVKCCHMRTFRYALGSKLDFY